ncbi:MAG TPA: DUF6480 family protein [Acidimicrobiales bacterium]|nr:DUF6480 family protein [Acidimicrobiales bacterium]
MASKNSRAGTRPDRGAQPAPSGTGGRRLGGQTPPARGGPSSGAARRYQRSQKKGSSAIGWASVAVVVVLVVVLVVVKLTSSSGNGSTSGAATGRNPSLAPASLVSAVATVPSTTFDAVGTAGEPAAFTVTSGQRPLTSGGKPRFVYVGGEFCPYCALMRWSMVAALSRFGSFHGLKLMSSATTDGDIPTFSFYGATYTSPYLAFTPYETEDRSQNPLQAAPSYVNSLYAKYDGSGTTPAAPFNPASSAGIPFLDIGNKYVSAGDPGAMALIFSQYGYLNNGGPGRAAVASAIRSPSSAVGTAIDAKVFVAQANYISAAICALDGGKPSSVCSSAGVKAASKVLAAAKPVS